MIRAQHVLIYHLIYTLYFLHSYVSTSAIKNALFPKFGFLFILFKKKVISGVKSRCLRILEERLYCDSVLLCTFFFSLSVIYVLNFFLSIETRLLDASEITANRTVIKYSVLHGIDVFRVCSLHDPP